MKFLINPFPDGGFISIPEKAAGEYLKIASDIQLRMLLWACKNGAGGFTSEQAAELFRVSPEEAESALSFWTDCGLLSSEEKPSTKSETETFEKRKAVRAETVKPDRNETVRRGLESPEIAFLLQEAQKKFGRALKQSESSTIVWLYDDEGVSVPLMLMLFEHAYAENNFRIGNIERTAMEWIDAGISDVKQAEDYLVMRKARKSAWATVERAMGIPHRRPSDREEELSYKWVEEWNTPFELLREAYNVCVDQKTRLDLRYVNKVIENWRSAGFTSVEEVRNNAAAGSVNSAAGSKGSSAGAEGTTAPGRGQRGDAAKTASGKRGGAYDIKLAEQMMMSGEGD